MKDVLYIIVAMFICAIPPLLNDYIEFKKLFDENDKLKEENNRLKIEVDILTDLLTERRK